MENMQNANYSLIKEENNETIDSWINRDYIGENLKEKLAGADILVVPNEEPRADVNHTPYFPEGTDHLISFLESSDTENKRIDVCIEDDNYKELALHWELLEIARLIATVVAAPVAVRLLADYISKKVGRRKDETTVKSSLTITDTSNGKSIDLTYEGPASTYEKVMFKAVEDSLVEIGEPSSEIKIINSSSEYKNESEQS